jgi:hypothetical protein
MAHDIKGIYQRYSQHLKDEFTTILGRVDHPGEKGMAREKALVKHLRRFLPQRYDIGTGFVIDAAGGISKQIDLILYDRIVSPVFNIGGDLNYYPAECVVAVGEVKSTITSNDRLKEALANVRSVKGLTRFAHRDRFGGDVNSSHGHISSAIPTDGILPEPYRVLSFIFTSESMSTDSVRDGLLEDCRTQPRNLRLNLYVDFERFLASHQDPDLKGGRLTIFPEGADRLYITKAEEKESIILLFTSLLHMFLMNARVQEPSLMAYFGIRSTEADSFPIEMVAG